MDFFLRRNIFLVLLTIISKLSAIHVKHKTVVSTYIEGKTYDMFSTYWTNILNTADKTRILKKTSRQKKRTTPIWTQSHLFDTDICITDYSLRARAHFITFFVHLFKKEYYRPLKWILITSHVCGVDTNVYNYLKSIYIYIYIYFFFVLSTLVTSVAMFQ